MPDDYDRPQPATAGQHPFPLNRADRAGRAKLHAIVTMISLVLAASAAGQLRELLDEAEQDVTRARRHGYEQACEEHRRAASERRG